MAKREIRLTSLDLSDNVTVNDNVVKDLTTLFSNSSTLVNLYLNKTQVTIEGLLILLGSIKDSLKVREIGVEGCGIDLEGENGQKVIEALMDNISLTKLAYAGNKFDVEFSEGADKELSLNREIVEKIFPQLIDQEMEAR